MRAAGFFEKYETGSATVSVAVMGVSPMTSAEIESGRGHE
jgi:hypothetical protein